VPPETAAISAQVLCTPYNHAPCHFMQSHICKVYACLVVTCHLHFWQPDRDLYVLLRQHGTDTEIRVSTESRPWRRKVSRRSCRDSNPRPFNHESGALAAELSPPSKRYTRSKQKLQIKDFCCKMPRWYYTEIKTETDNDNNDFFINKKKNVYCF